jgi:protease-4
MLVFLTAVLFGVSFCASFFAAPAYGEDGARVKLFGPAMIDAPPKEKNKDKDKQKDKEDQDDDEDKDKSKEEDKAKQDEKDKSDDEDKAKDEEKSKPEPKDEQKAKTEKAADKGKDKGKGKEEAKPTPIKKLVEVRLDRFLVPARAINIPLPGRTQTVRELLERLEKYGKDEEIGAVLLDLDGLGLSLPDVEELRTGIAGLRKSGKKVFAFLNQGEPNGYFVACQADEIALAPTGSLILPGIGRLFPFLRGMYQMQGIEFDVITAGRFKYPGFVNQREPNKYFLEEFEGILNDWYGDYVKYIADGRKLSPEKVKETINIALFNAEEAKNRGLVDTLAYYEDYRDHVLRKHKFEKGKAPGSEFAQVTSLNDLLNAWQKQVAEAQKSYTAVGPKIAILHARGPIVDVSLGAGLAGQMIMRDEFVATIEQIRKNKTIRGVVLYIDSPGGSGYASDVIWQKLRQLDEEKPLVVCMGSVAGSGGYYIACPARLIFAQPTTITGSIGVLAILQNQASALNRRDVNVYEMRRGARSLLGSGHRDVPPEDRAFIQKHILDFYEIFLDRVAVTRKMAKDEVRKIAEGRIYTGRQALKIGLVDRLGGLNDAIAAVREMADIPPSAEVKLVHYPKPASIGELVESLAGFSLGMGAAGATPTGQTAPMTPALEMTRIMQLLAQAQAQSPAPCVSFDEQLRYFARSPVQPLCWMAIPEVHELLNPTAPRSVLGGVMP